MNNLFDLLSVKMTQKFGWFAPLKSRPNGDKSPILVTLWPPFVNVSRENPIEWEEMLKKAGSVSEF